MEIREIRDLQELKDKLQVVKDQLDDVTDEEWQAYVKVRDILALETPLPGAVRCAMLGIFETPEGPGTLGEYDAGAVERFANLGE